jgi:adenine-specific DNA-methyltransferase
VALDGGDGRYEGLSREQLIALLQRRDRRKKLGLVWERDEIEADQALEAEFVSADLIAERSDPATGQGGWPNLVIEGDNYDALRWLRMTLAGRVKCIYVDPPYNTGAKDWVYNDHYVGKDDRWRHSTWLEFLYRRFTLARDLLSEDGVLLVSINDENRAKLELLLDEVLPGMRVGSFVWRNRKNTGVGHQAFLSQNHEHILVYASAHFSFGGSKRDVDQYQNPDEDSRGAWSSGPLTLGFSYTQRPNLYYPLYDPQTDVWYPCNPERVWAYASKDRIRPGQRLQTQPMEMFVSDHRILFPKDAKVAVWETKEELMAAISSGDVPMSGRVPLLRPGLPDLDFWVGKRVGFGTPRTSAFSKISPKANSHCHLGLFRKASLRRKHPKRTRSSRGPTTRVA